MTRPSEREQTKPDILQRDSQFALAVAARALVRAAGINPFQDAVVASTPVKIGAWPTEFGAVLAVCPINEAPALLECVSAILSDDARGVWERLGPEERAVALAEWKRITGKDGRS